MPTEKKTKRMVCNGMRLQEGKDNDWYEMEDGKIVFLHMREVDSGDKIIFEYPDFSEEELSHKEIYLKCRCGTLIPTTRTLCGPCQAKRLSDEIESGHAKICTLKKGINQKEFERQTVIREWQEYLKEEDERAVSRRRDTES